LGLCERIQRLAARARPLSGIVYRSAVPKYANSEDLLTGEGARRFGGRWNPPGVAAVYGSFAPQTAMEEALAQARYYGLPAHAAMPRTFVAIEFDLARVIDLTDGAVRRSLGVSEKRVLECDWRVEAAAGWNPLTQEIGEGARLAELEALVVSSAADRGGRNLVVFVENLLPESRLSVAAVNRPDRA
jgi:RES domain-containing protein